MMSPMTASETPPDSLWTMKSAPPTMRIPGVKP